MSYPLPRRKEALKRENVRTGKIHQALAQQNPSVLRVLRLQIKASGKKTLVKENALNDFRNMWSIKQHDLAIKERLSKMSLLDSLIAKKEPLADYEEALKKKLINDLLSN